MGLYGAQKLTATLAGVFLVFFLLSFILHAVIPHDHPHQEGGVGFLSAVHTILAEKFFTVAILCELLLIHVLFFYAPQLVAVHMRRSRLAMRMILFRHAFTGLFSGGILNGRAY